MSTVGDDELRIRLEGKAELLEATLPRYQVLVPALASFTWKNKLRKNLEVLGAVARDQVAVDEALAVVARRAEIEAWPEGPVLRCALEVRTLRSKLRALVERRRGDALTRVLAEDLQALEREVVGAPRLVLPSERWALACQLLPADLAGLQTVSKFAALAEQQFAAPLELSRLPTFEAFTEFKYGWRESLQILQTLWGRLSGIDLTGGVERSLRRRSLRQPRFTDQEVVTGPALLVQAQYWHLVSHTRMATFVNERLEPVTANTSEVMRVFGWLLRRQTDPTVSLSDDSMASSRLALLELAALLRGVTGPRVARPFAKLLSLATAADADKVDGDWWKLRDSLLTVVRAAKSGSTRLPPVYRAQASRLIERTLPSQTLAGLIGELEASLVK